MKKKILILPSIFFFLVLSIFFYLLIIERNPSEIPSNLINKKVPIFEAESLFKNEKFVSSNEFRNEITLVNYDPWQSSYENPINEIEEPCTELYRRMFVWWDGKVNPCDYDYKSTLSKWNANFMSIKDIWCSPYFNELRNLHMKNSSFLS